MFHPAEFGQIGIKNKDKVDCTLTATIGMNKLFKTDLDVALWMHTTDCSSDVKRLDKLGDA